MDLDHLTGGPVEGWDHVVQSILTILSTRLATRVFLRAFGSDLPALVDAPLNEMGVMALNVAIADALERWEPRFELSEVGIEADEDGAVAMTLVGSYRPEAHLGDLTVVADGIQTVRIQSDRAEVWRVAA